MRAWGKAVTTIVAGSMMLAAFATTADARRWRLRVPSFGASMGRAQTIDLVEALPDTEAFERDGRYYDLGYLHDSGSLSDGRYVLYNGERYMRVDTPMETAIAAELGRNPIEGHRGRTATEKGSKPSTVATLEPRSGESREAFRERARAFAADRQSTSAAAERASVAPAMSGAGGGFAIMLALMLIGALLFGGRRFIAAVTGGAASAAKQVSRATAPTADGDNGVSQTSFDQAVAARLREINAPRSAQTAGVSPDIKPAARTFGRRGVA